MMCCTQAQISTLSSRVLLFAPKLMPKGNNKKLHILLSTYSVYIYDLRIPMCLFSLYGRLVIISVRLLCSQVNLARLLLLQQQIMAH